MNPRSSLRRLCLAASLPLAAAAQVMITESYVFSTAPLPLSPPDGTGAPVSDTRSLNASAIAKITDVNVSFTLSNPVAGGAFNGDFYVSLQHRDGFSVLLNRVGRRPGSSFSQTLGYGDNGFRVSFDDQAVLGDIHVYRATLSGGSHTTAVDPDFVQPLTGLWAPDGRATSPLSARSTDPRTALLGAFNGLAANGAWTLQVLDFNGGGTAALSGWGISLTGEATAVPEPAATAALTGLTLLALAARRRWPAGRKAVSTR